MALLKHFVSVRFVVQVSYKHVEFSVSRKIIINWISNKRINQLLFPLKLSENRRFSDDSGELEVN